MTFQVDRSLYKFNIPFGTFDEDICIMHIFFKPSIPINFSIRLYPKVGQYPICALQDKMGREKSGHKGIR